MIDWSTWATWGRGEAAERAVYASRNLDMGDKGDRGYGKLGDGKRTEKATAKSGVVEERVASRVWVGVVKRFAFALVRDGGRRKEKREERTWSSRADGN